MQVSCLQDVLGITFGLVLTICLGSLVILYLRRTEIPVLGPRLFSPQRRIHICFGISEPAYYRVDKCGEYQFPFESCWIQIQG